MTTAENVPTDLGYEPADRLSERFTRVFGRRPTAAELVRFQRARSGLELRLPAQVRRTAATVLANL
jgi:hypothetical protein